MNGPVSIDLKILFVEREQELVERTIFRIYQSELFDLRNTSVLGMVAALGITASLQTDQNATPLAAITFWNAFKAEFKRLVCTRDPRYRQLRLELAKNAREPTTVLTGMIAVEIGQNIGAVPGLLTPLVVVCLIVLLRVGQAAFCRMRNIDTQKPFRKPNPAKTTSP